MDEWTKTWPAEPGWYWFWGWCWKSRKGKYELHSVRVHQASNDVAYVTNGHFLYQEEGAGGYWIATDLPKPPNTDEEGG